MKKWYVPCNICGSVADWNHEKELCPQCFGERRIWVNSPLKVLRHVKPNEDIEETLAVALYEMGDLAKSVCYQRWNLEDKKLYKGEAGIAIGDLVMQLRLISEMLELDFDKCISNGEEAFLHRFNKELKGKVF